MDLPAAIGDTLAQAQASWNILRTQLNQRFIQLANPSVVMAAMGNSEVEWAGGVAASKYVEITHGLGAEAKKVYLGVQVNAVGAFAEWENVSATKIKVRLQCPFGAPAVGTKAKFSWKAMT